jgi:hypothetical protein
MTEQESIEEKWPSFSLAGEHNSTSFGIFKHIMWFDYKIVS